MPSLRENKGKGKKRGGFQKGGKKPHGKRKGKKKSSGKGKKKRGGTMFGPHL